MLVRVYVTPKRDVLDPQGEAVCASLRSLGFDEVRGVRVGKYIELDVRDGMSTCLLKKRIDEMCSRLLANATIESYRFEIQD